MNKFVIYEEDTLNFCVTNFDLEEKEIKTTVTNTYKNQIADFAKFAMSANVQTIETSVINSTENEIPEEEDYLKQWQIINQH